MPLVVKSAKCLQVQEQRKTLTAGQQGRHSKHYRHPALQVDMALALPHRPLRPALQHVHLPTCRGILLSVSTDDSPGGSPRTSYKGLLDDHRRVDGIAARYPRARRQVDPIVLYQCAYFALAHG